MANGYELKFVDGDAPSTYNYVGFDDSRLGQIIIQDLTASKSFDTSAFTSSLNGSTYSARDLHVDYVSDAINYYVETGTILSFDEVLANLNDRIAFNDTYYLENSSKLKYVDTKTPGTYRVKFDTIYGVDGTILDTGADYTKAYLTLGAILVLVALRKFIK